MSATSWVLLAIATVVVVGALCLWTPDESRQELEAKYLRAPTDYIDVAGIKLHVRDTGPRDGPPVLLLHGFASSLQTWEPWSEALSTDMRVLRLDLPGSGLTGADPTGNYSDARGIEVLLALLDKLQLPRISVVGNSIGGRLAWKLAAQEPLRVVKLVLISPDGFASPGFEYGHPAHVPATLQMLKYTLPKALLRLNLRVAYANPDALTDEVLTRYYDMMLAPGVRSAMIDRLRQTVLDDPVPILCRIRAPTLILWGEKDQMIPVSNAADYLKAIPHSTLIRLPDLGHVPQEEAPRTSLLPVRNFLRNDATPVVAHFHQDPNSPSTVGAGGA
jgi:pimeloyl-ACP methyl ester carboxylesterase